MQVAKSMAWKNSFRNCLDIISFTMLFRFSILLSPCCDVSIIVRKSKKIKCVFKYNIGTNPYWRGPRVCAILTRAVIGLENIHMLLDPPTRPNIEFFCKHKKVPQIIARCTTLKLHNHPKKIHLPKPSLSCYNSPKRNLLCNKCYLLKPSSWVQNAWK